MAKDKKRVPRAKPRLWGFTREYGALRDLCDQLIAQRGGSKFVPRPEIPGLRARWDRKDAALQSTVDRLCGTD